MSSELIRLTLQVGQMRCDVAVPKGTTLKDIYPQLGHLPADSTAHLLSGEEINPNQTVGCGGVVSGAVIVFSPRPSRLLRPSRRGKMPIRQTTVASFMAVLLVVGSLVLTRLVAADGHKAPEVGLALGGVVFAFYSLVRIKHDTEGSLLSSSAITIFLGVSVLIKVGLNNYVSDHPFLVCLGATGTLVALVGYARPESAAKFFSGLVFGLTLFVGLIDLFSLPDFNYGPVMVVGSMFVYSIGPYSVLFSTAKMQSQNTALGSTGQVATNSGQFTHQSITKKDFIVDHDTAVEVVRQAVRNLELLTLWSGLMVLGACLYFGGIAQASSGSPAQQLNVKDCGFISLTIFAGLCFCFTASQIWNYRVATISRLFGGLILAAAVIESSGFFYPQKQGWVVLGCGIVLMIWLPWASFRSWRKRPSPSRKKSLFALKIIWMLLFPTAYFAMGLFPYPELFTVQ